MLWGAYTWADGKTPRADGLTWLPADFNAKDGTHPSESGTTKVAQLLLKFFRHDPTARSWWNQSSIKEK